MNSKESLNLEEVLIIYKKLNSGKTVLCKICEEPIIIRRPGSGYHPGLFCPNGCTEAYIEFDEMQPEILKNSK